MIGGLPENSFTDSIVFGLYNIAFSFVVFFIMLNFIIAIIVEVLTLLAVLLQKYSFTGTKVHMLALPDLHESYANAATKRRRAFYDAVFLLYWYKSTNIDAEGAARPS
jgi:hypothetical protein